MFSEMFMVEIYQFRILADVVVVGQTFSCMTGSPRPALRISRARDPQVSNALARSRGTDLAGEEVAGDFWMGRSVCALLSCALVT